MHSGQILGIGIDLVNVNRFSQVMARRGQALLDRLFTAHEQAYAKDHAFKEGVYAKRFAAKEAFSKAVGVGIGPLFQWKDLEVQNDRWGRPFFVLALDVQAKIVAHLGTSFESFLSLTDDLPYAQAFVLITAS